MKRRLVTAIVAVMILYPLPIRPTIMTLEWALLTWAAWTVIRARWER